MEMCPPTLPHPRGLLQLLFSAFTESVLCKPLNINCVILTVTLLKHNSKAGYKHKVVKAWNHRCSSLYAERHKAQNVKMKEKYILAEISNSHINMSNPFRKDT